MPMPVFLTIEAENQGMISDGAGTRESIGNDSKSDHEDEIMAHAVDHTIMTPCDVQSGQPTGTRIHKPFRFTCSLNKAVPLLYNALANGEFLVKVTCNWYRVQQGQEEIFFTHTLEDAVCVDIRLAMPNCKNLDNADFTQNVDVSLAYRKMGWDHITSSSSGSDDWRSPTA